MQLGYDDRKEPVQKETEMLINIGPELEAAITEQARLQKMDPNNSC